MARTSAPYLLFFPYLPIKGSYNMGPWYLAPLKSYTGPWLNADFERQSKTFMASFRDASGKPLDNMYVLSHGARGMDGRLPTGPQRVAIQCAVDFAILDNNPAHDSDNAGLGTATTDNTELFIWPIDVAGGRVTLSRGSMVQLMAGGHRIDGKLKVPAPLELQMPTWIFSLDGELLAAMYHLFTRRLSGINDQDRRRIEVAVGWLSKAWRNSTSISMADRVVFLKTGFEALSDEYKTEACARWLRSLYETQLAGNIPKYTRHLLWSPAEKPARSFKYRRSGNMVRQLTDLQRWFMTFGEARNSIIHEGMAPSLVYRHGKSRYNGPMVNIGERLLRESIKVKMISLGYPNLWRTSMWRAIDRSLKKAKRRRK